MGHSTEELRRDIEDTRADMSYTLDAIGDRVSPGRMMTRRKNRMSSSIQSLRDRVMGTASDAQHGMSAMAEDATESIKHAPEAVAERTQGAPMVAGGIALGIGFLAAVAFPATDKEKRAASKMMDTLEPAKQQLTDSAKEMADHLKEPAMEAAERVKQSASEGASQVADTARDAAGETRQQTAESAQRLQA